MKIEIESVENIEIQKITTNERYFNSYLRFSTENWFHSIARNGGTWIKMNDCELLEKGYQAWKKKSQ